MKRPLIIVLALLLLGVIGLELSGRAMKRRLETARKPAPPAPEAVPVPPPPSRVGEKIVYEVRMGGLKLGQSVFEQLAAAELEGKPADVFLFETKLIRFTDTEKIFADPATYLPVRVERRIVMWPKNETIIEEYDQKAFLVKLRRRGRQEEIKSTAPLQNAILLPFLLREDVKLEAGWRKEINLPTQKFAVVYAGAETVKVPAGEFKTYHFTSDPDKFEVWVTADGERIPVKIRGTSGIGYVMFMSGYTPPAAGREKTKE